MNKRNLGAFYTTNTSAVFGHYDQLIASQQHITDPFVGEGYLLQYASRLGVESVTGVDNNPDVSPDTVNNSIMSPVWLDGFIFTNPPYLLNNKASDKTAFVKWGVDDLFKASLKMLSQFSNEGLVVVPQNLFLDDDWEFRKQLFSVWEIFDLVWHEGVVFDDTNTRVVCFQYRKGKTTELHGEPLVDDAYHKLRYGYDWWEIQRIGQQQKIKCKRLIDGIEAPYPLGLVARCTDTGKSGGELGWEVGEPFYGKVSDRNKASFSINTVLEEAYLCERMNKTIQECRSKYGSKVLTNFLQSEGVTRKRASFKQMENLLKYSVCNHTEL